MNSTATGATAVPTGNTFDKYGSTNPIEQRMMKGFMASLDSLLEGLEPTRILEIGVGEGEVMARLRDRFPGVPIVGLDLADDRLAADWRERGLSCIFADATSLPFPDRAFDLVVSIEVLEHVLVPDQAVAEIERVCSGAFLASVPFEPIWCIGNIARGRYLRSWGNTPGHVNHWSRWGFARFVGRRFDVEHVKSPPPWTMVLARRRGS